MIQNVDLKNKTVKNLKINKKNIKKWAKRIVIGAVILTTVKTTVSIVYDYKYEINNVEKNLDYYNGKIISLINDVDADNVTFTVVGNSISTGYSTKDPIIPLLKRNTDLIKKLDKSNIQYEIYHFARAVDNSDDHTLRYLLENTKVSEMYQKNRYDLVGQNATLTVLNHKISDAELDEHYPTVIGNDKGLHDIIISNNPNEMNIVIYNGLTGSWLDEITRGSHNKFNSFDKDLAAIEAFCKYILVKCPNTQIYFCGMPNYFNMNVVDIINKKVRSLERKYPNFTYVDPAASKLIYKSENTGKLTVDIHFNKKEYLWHNKNIVETISENYISNKICTDLYVTLRELNDFIQFDTSNNKKYEKLINDTITLCLDNYKNSNISDELIRKAVDKFLNIYAEDSGSKFFFIDEHNASKIIKSYIDSELSHLKVLVKN